MRRENPLLFYPRRLKEIAGTYGPALWFYWKLDGCAAKSRNGWRLSAPEIERTVVAAARQLLNDQAENQRFRCKLQGLAQERFPYRRGGGRRMEPAATVRSESRSTQRLHHGRAYKEASDEPACQ